MNVEEDGKRAVVPPVKRNTASIIPIKKKRAYQKKTILTSDVACASGICQASEEFRKGKMKQYCTPLRAAMVCWRCFMRILKLL